MENKKTYTEEEIKEELLQAIENDEQYKQWFNQYAPSTWNYFITNYARLKTSALNLSDYHKSKYRPSVLEFNEYAWRILEHIQLKKLFNLQCEWRAERIQLPFIKICNDFLIFEENVMDCPFLPPVTLEEVETYIEYIKDCDPDEFEDWDLFDEWEESLTIFYSLLKKDAENDECTYTPLWFEFYDQKYGTDYLIHLPDIRGEKEKRYINAIFPAKEKVQETQPKTAESQAKEMPKKNFSILCDPDEVMEFMKKFEDEDVAEAIIPQLRDRKMEYDFGDLDEAYDYLKHLSEPIAFVPHDDWKEALYRTVYNYRIERIIKAMPRIWRRYIKEVGDDVEAYMHRRIAAFDKKQFEEHAYRVNNVKQILDGRELLGEPRNLDF